MNSQPAVILDATFSPKLKTYHLVTNTAFLIFSIIGIPLLPFWAFIGPWWARRHFAALGCVLTERSVIVRKGVFFRREVTIPLDKIQDVSLRDGPLLRRFGLVNLRIETAGQSTTAAGTSEADLVGLTDARGFRERVLALRDRTTAVAAPATNEQLRHIQVLEEIRDVLLRIEARGAGPVPPPDDEGLVQQVRLP